MIAGFAEFRCEIFEVTIIEVGAGGGPRPGTKTLATGMPLADLQMFGQKNAL